MYNFHMDLDNLRYQEIYGYGYVDGMDRPTDTPSIAIGKCVKVS